MRRHLLPNINPIQAPLRPSCSAFASCPPVRGHRIRPSRRCSCFRQTYSNWNPQTTAFRPRGRRATTSSSRASSSFRLITALLLRGDWGISWTQIKDTRPSKPTTSNVRILAALADPQCNGSIYLVGGSAGGCLVLWCGLDSASTVTGWDNNARLHIKAVVSFSGPTNLDDWSHPDITDYTDFETRVDNYVG